MALRVVVALGVVDQALVEGERLRTAGTLVRVLVLVFRFAVAAQLVGRIEQGGAVETGEPIALHVHLLDVPLEVAVLGEAFVANVTPEVIWF